MKTLSAILLLLLLPVLGWAQAPIYRQFFTTNPAPVVDVVAGSNATVVASTPAVNIRRFTVSSTAVGLSNIVDAGYVAAARNLDVATNLTTLVTSYSNTPVASLGTPSVGQFPIRYASDVITSRGTGDFVRWDGSSWRTTDNVVATANLTTFIFACINAGLNTFSALSTISLQTDMGGDNRWSYLPRSTSSTGTGASYATGISFYSTNGIFNAPITGTDATGSARAYGLTVPSVTNNMTIGCGGKYWAQALCSDAERYWVLIGMDTGGSSATYPTSGAFFLYDMYNVNSHGLTGEQTNNWICVAVSGATYTYTNSGLAVSISEATAAHLAVVLTNGAALFYTNGTFANMLTANVPNGALYMNKVIMQKTAGTTSRQFREQFPFAHVRYGTSRALK